MATSREVIQTAYLQALGRPADPEGLSFYSSQLESGRSLGDILKDLNYAASTGAEDVARNQQITAAGGWDFAPAAPQAPAQQTQQAVIPPAVNPFFPTYTPRQDINYDQLFGARPLESGGTPPTPEAINKAFETFFNRPADIPGIQGYLTSGKSMEQINADLAYQALYAPERNLAPNAQYYEAPSQGQLGYIQSLGGGTPVGQRADTFSFTAPTGLSEAELRSIYKNQLGYEPTSEDVEFWTKIYPMSPDVRYSPNPQQQTINAILAGSNKPRFDYLKSGVDLTGTAGVNYAGTPMSPAQVISRNPYVDYSLGEAQETSAPFGGFFGDSNFNPFDYTGIAPTPLTYTGYDPTSVQYQSNLANLAQYNVPVTPTPTGEEGIAALPVSTPT
jgi:hypothetical protein